MKNLLTTAILCGFVLFTACSEQKTSTKTDTSVKTDTKTAQTSTSTAKTDETIGKSHTPVVQTTTKSNAVCDLDFVKIELNSSFSNEMIVLDEVKCQNGDLFYRYTYTPQYSAELEKLGVEQRAEALKTMKNMLKSMYCDMPEFEPFRQNDVALHYDYSTTNMAKFYQVKVSKSDCGK